MKRIELVLVGLLLWAGAGYAGEALITKVRGASLTIDSGAEAGLVPGKKGGLDLAGLLEACAAGEIDTLLVGLRRESMHVVESGRAPNSNLAD